MAVNLKEVNGEYLAPKQIAKTRTKFDKLIQILQSTQVDQGSNYPQIALIDRKGTSIIVTKMVRNYQIQNNRSGKTTENTYGHGEFEQNYRWYI